MMDVWQWTLSNDAIAPCFVRDVHDLRSSDADFFWLGHTPCRTVLLVGMVVAVQAYDQRAVYTIDDGTAVIDCVLRHPRRINPEPLPPPLTGPGYPVRVVGKVVRHYQSKQIHADSIDLCPSSLDEIAHLERVIELHKTKYSLAVPFVPPPKPCVRASDTGAPDTPIPQPFRPTTASYVLPAPPTPLRDRNRPPARTHAPSSPTASSTVSSTPSSPCKSSSPIKPHESPSKAKLRHPSRLHTRDLTANTFRLYVKHYMDNAPSPFSVPSWFPPRADVATPTKSRCRPDTRGREDDEATPRPCRETELDQCKERGQAIDEPTLGFTLSHLRRVPELALLGARVVRVESRKRDKAERDKLKATSQAQTGESKQRSTFTLSKTNGDSHRKKLKRLFSWAVVKLHEEGSIVLWDGEVRPLPVPPPPFLVPDKASGIWDNNTLGSLDPSVSASTCGSRSMSMLYDLSASASLYSHYHAPRRQGRGTGTDADDDADPGEVSDPCADEEAYVPVNAQLLMVPVREAFRVLSSRRGRGRGQKEHGAVTAEEVLACIQRTDGRWAKVGVWAIEEVLALA